MRDFKRRVITAILGFAVIFALGGCATDNNPPTTSPGDTTTTAPVGS